MARLEGRDVDLPPKSTALAFSDAPHSPPVQLGQIHQVLLRILVAQNSF